MTQAVLGTRVGAGARDGGKDDDTDEVMVQRWMRWPTIQDISNNESIAFEITPS